MWQQIRGHDKVVEQFQRASRRRRLSGSYLFTGPKGVGKRTFALALAKSLLCQHHTPEHLDACGICPSCTQFDAEGHPDLIDVAKPADKTMLPVELLVGEKEKRGKSGLCYEISRKPFAGGYKIAIIDDADDLNQEGANALLKTLEEPPPQSLLILIGTSAAKQLPTIRSRCKLIRFLPIPILELSQLILDREIVESEERALQLAKSSDGGLASVQALCDNHLDSFRETFFQELSLGVRHPVEFATKLNEFIEAAGKEALPRRKRLRLVLNMALDFYRFVAQIFAGADPTKLNRRDLLPYAQKSTQSYCQDVNRVIAAAEETFTALEQVDRNAQIPFIIDALVLRLSKT